MPLPILPIEARTDVTITSNFNPNLYQYSGGVARRNSRNYRKASKGSVNMSTYVPDIQLVNNFLHSLQGYKPFQLPQDGLNYICSKWTITYASGNKGTVQLEMMRYLNPV